MCVILKLKNFRNILFTTLGLQVAHLVQLCEQLVWEVSLFARQLAYNGNHQLLCNRVVQQTADKQSFNKSTDSKSFQLYKNSIWLSDRIRPP